MNFVPPKRWLGVGVGGRLGNQCCLPQVNALESYVPSDARVTQAAIFSRAIRNAAVSPGSPVGAVVCCVHRVSEELWESIWGVGSVVSRFEINPIGRFANLAQCRVYTIGPLWRS